MATAAQSAQASSSPGNGGVPAVEAKRIRVVKSTAAPPPSGGPASAAADESEAAALDLLGRAVWLMSLSQFHKHQFLSDLEWRLRPPLMLRQCRLFLKKNRPFAFVTWAFVSDEVEQQLKTTKRLRPDQWRCGPKPVFMDVVTPFDGMQEVRQEIIKTVFEKARPQAQAAASSASPAAKE